jgi:hypothetical protein
VLVQSSLYYSFIILEDEGKHHIVLSLDMKRLFPLLKVGLIMGNFSHDGNIYEDMDQLHIHAKDLLIVFAHTFNILVGILLYPKVLEHFKDFAIFSSFYMRFKFHISAWYRICKTVK